jgi:hypothetical protein
MFAVGPRFSGRYFFNGDHVQRINSRDDSLSAVNKDQPNAGRHHHEVWVRHWHTSAIAQAKHKWLRVALPTLAYPLRIHIARKLTDAHNDFNREGSRSYAQSSNP